MNDSILYNGKLFQVVNRINEITISHDKQNFTVKLNYELIKRPPGVRAIITKNHQIFLNKEFRYEMNNWDYRLPGGKVFDSFIEYEIAINNGSIFECVDNGLCRELLEETGIVPKEYEMFYKSTCGFTVEWDIYYFIVNEFEKSPKFDFNNIRKNEYEYIDHCWMDYDKVFEYCLQRKISEERSSNALMRFIINSKG